MTSASPTIVTVETGSAWVVILLVSVVTLAAVFVFRKLIRTPGGRWSTLLLSLPLVLPLVAAVIYQQGVLPEISVLRPVDVTSLRSTDSSSMHLVMVANGRTSIPYLVLGSTGPYLLGIAVVATSFMLLRRFVGFVGLRRELGRCSAVDEASHLGKRFAGLRYEIAAPPTTRLLTSRKGCGAFAVAGPKSAVVVSDSLLEDLTDEEIDGIVAHELAHIASHDIEVLSGARFLRDLVVWNPFAHLALNRLTAERELEADRRAAAAIGDPLTVASGLVKMCELLRAGSPGAPLGAVAFLRRRGRLKQRVANLLAMADGALPASSSNHLPYAAAVCLALVLGLQAGARIAGDGQGAVALVIGSSTSSVSVWRDSANPNVEARRAASASVAKRDARFLRRAKTVPRAGHGALVRRFPMLARSFAFKPGDVARFFRTFGAYARTRGMALKPMLWDAHPVLTAEGAALQIYRIESVPARGL